MNKITVTSDKITVTSDNLKNYSSNYESPIKMWTTEVELRYEKEVLNAISHLNVEVNREELIRALNYDRNQYEKGYRDGLLSVLKEPSIPLSFIEEKLEHYKRREKYHNENGWYNICENDAAINRETLEYLIKDWEKENEIN